MDLREARILAMCKMEEYKLQEWKFKFDNAKQRFGSCNFRTKTISLSKPLTELNNREIVLDTILHEIAHALVPRHHQHDKVWREKAISIGCNGKRCFDKLVTTPKGKYEYWCETCGYKLETHKKLKKKTACGTCCRKYNNGKHSDEYILRWKTL